MVVVIKTKNNVNRIRERLSKQKMKKFDALKFCGILKLEEDPLELQKRWRSEWE
jgi:hypothetical protein